MKLTNLSTLFTTHVSNNVLPQQVGFKNAAPQTFQFEGLEAAQDRFSTNPIYKGLQTKAEIQRLADANPRINYLRNKYNLKEINMEALEDM